MTSSTHEPLHRVCSSFRPSSHSHISDIMLVSSPSQACLRAFNVFSLGRNRILNNDLCDISLFANARLTNDCDADYFSPSGQYHSFRGNSLSTNSMTDVMSVELLTCVSQDVLFVKGKYLNCCRNFYSGCLVENLWPIRDSRFVSVDENQDIVLRMHLWSPTLFSWNERQTILDPPSITISNPKLSLGNGNSFFWIPLVGMNIDLTNGILINLTKNEMVSISVVDPKLCLVRTRPTASESGCSSDQHSSLRCSSSSPPVIPSPPVPVHWNLQTDWFGLLRSGANLFTDPNGKLALPCSEGDTTIRLFMSDMLSSVSPFRTFLGIEELFFRVVSVDEIEAGVVKLEKPVSRNFPENFPVRIINCNCHFQGTLNPPLNEICSAVCPPTITSLSSTSSPASSSSSSNHVICSTSNDQFIHPASSALPNMYNLRWKGGNSMSVESQKCNVGSRCSNGTPNLVLMALNTITLPNMLVKCENSETKLSSFPVLLVDINDSQSNNVRFKPNIMNNAGKIGNRFSFVANFDSEIGSGRLFVKYVGDFISKPFPLDLDCRNLNISIRNATDGSVIRFIEADTVPPAPPLPRMQWTIEMRISSERCA